MTEIKIGPPPIPNRDKYPFVGTANVQGLKINIENLKGSVREGTGPNGKTWKTKMHFHYGEIEKTKGVDRDKLDVYIGPNPNSKRVFIVHQNHPGDHPTKAGKYDEDKVMLGFVSPEDAKRAYLKQYDRKDFFRSMTEMDIGQFKNSIFKENKGEKVAMKLKSAAVAEQKKNILAQGRQKLMQAYPGKSVGEALRAEKTQDKISAAACKTPGKKIRSKGKGRGLATGKGRGPIGRPGKKKPSAFIRTQMKGASLKEAYDMGARQALIDKMAEGADINEVTPVQPVTPLAQQGVKMPSAPSMPGMTLGPPVAPEAISGAGTTEGIATEAPTA